MSEYPASKPTIDLTDIRREAARLALDGLTVERLARAVLIAAREYGWLRTTDGFEWYGSADEMAEGILAALRDEGETT